MTLLFSRIRVPLWKQNYAIAVRWVSSRGRTPTMSTAEPHEVLCTELAPGGDTVGRIQSGADAGLVSFVSLAAPDERVKVRITRRKNDVAWAELTEIITPSPARVDPPCPLFGRCGGCQWQHVSRAKQIESKEQIVRKALSRQADLATVGLAMDAPVPDLQSRERVRLCVGPSETVGFRMRRTRQVIDVPSCPVMSPELQSVFPAVRKFARTLPAGAEVALLAGNDGVHMDITSPPGQRWTPRGAIYVDGVAGISVDQKQVSGVADVDIAERADAPPLRATAGGFAQVSRAANARLIQSVIEAVAAVQPRIVREFFAGSGNFTRHLVRVAETVHASDANEIAVAAGKVNAPDAHWKLTSANVRKPTSVGSFDVAVLDPARDGVSEEVLDVVAQAHRRVVYVSCDPQTLGRDVKRLKALGWRVAAVQVLDLMPHTFHVESVVTLEPDVELIAQREALKNSKATQVTDTDQSAVTDQSVSTDTAVTATVVSDKQVKKRAGKRLLLEDEAEGDAPKLALTRPRVVL
eukprot:TRINITY_DN2348_c0_g1_i1.p1 TRINITY_DN2348_c0_g1~~TRINITY_DN2348_c0_g1_i1.p1  ORF type:complete len:523 (-),score=113.15 TRINITY_DN2348_c0_g1_i1:113-1681(-)